MHQRQPLGLHARDDRRRLLGGEAWASVSTGAGERARRRDRGARGELAYGSIEEVWRRVGAPRAPIERLTEADAFHALGQDRRQGLWKVRGLGDAPLPLFSAAEAHEDLFSPEALESQVTLMPMTAGREVVEDYRSLQLSLKAHPLAFLRGDLTRRGVVRCADLARIKDGRHVEVAGLVLFRPKPGSA